LAEEKNGTFRGLAITAIVLGTIALGLYAIVAVFRIANPTAQMTMGIVLGIVGVVFLNIIYFYFACC